ncbi:MAG: hypothetical protein IT535_02420 [Bauldia sp.]|nr:hypothetical protein [Bauldia sp.]
MIIFALVIFALSAIACVANGVYWRQQGNTPMALMNIGLGVVQVVLLVLLFGGLGVPTSAP